ncbi:MAG: septum formation inhibitor Maf [Acidobacteria bacterium]|nr:septum formation inhibitor Maf [Acidobacteriota bacterium]
MLILASASPRRAELLRNAGFEFRVAPAHVPEYPLPGEEPARYVERLARSKAQAVAALFPHNTVLAADTTVVLDRQLLEKPRDAADAARMLRLLSGRTHQVITGVCVIAGAPERLEHEITRVRMDTISESDIENYIATGEPMDKAGAYAIQGIASRWISYIEGCYFNVVGLPVGRVYRMLKNGGGKQL